ncbi:hypothetical protein GGI07_004787 [Coemansia sp. Benny D115]|nr:hypothetical protein GGI07_004787 [Coemansia sp. Benny D115]
MKVPPFAAVAAALLAAATAVQAALANQQHAFLAGSNRGRPEQEQPAQTQYDTTAEKWAMVTKMDALPNFQLRIKKPRLCDTNVTQYSGYLDTAEDKHFFFWFFEARKGKREDAPLILWLNGGPGCSSFTGLLMELGPCRAMAGGNGTEYNVHSWNDRAHVIFLDQPTNVGFSHGSSVFNSVAAGKDVSALLQLFYESFPQYAQSKLHVFGESYGGHYVPAVAKAIHEDNQALEQRKRQAQTPGKLWNPAWHEPLRRLPLESIGIGNGFVDPLVQYGHYSRMACNSTYGAVLSQDQCRAMDDAYPTCARLTQRCYRWQNALACVPAMLYCSSKIEGPYLQSGLNPYDVRKPCEQGSLCYPILEDIDAYLNRPEVQRELGAEVSKFVSCSDKVNMGFSLNGDGAKPFHQEIPPLLADGIRVLIYAGDADFICNWYGNKAWALAMEWPGRNGLNKALDHPWTVGNKSVGEVRSHGNFTFLRVYGAGHMVPYDQPASALDMINRWLEGKRYSDKQR